MPIKLLKATGVYGFNERWVNKLSRRLTIEKVTKDAFYQIPKVMLHSDKYEGLSALSILAYGVLKDRASLSIKNGWYQKNDQGESEIYFIFTNVELMKVLGIKSNSTVTRVKKELEKFGLLEQERQGMNRPNKLFLCQVDTDIEDYQTISEGNYQQGETVGNQGSTESVSPESVLPEVRKLYSSNTDISNTNKYLDTKDTQNDFSKSDCNQINKNKNDYMKQAFYENQNKVPIEISNMLQAFYGERTEESQKHYQSILKAKAKAEKELNIVIWLENDEEATRAIVNAFSLAIRRIERKSNVRNPDGYIFKSIYNALSEHYQDYNSTHCKNEALYNWIEDDGGELIGSRNL